MSITIKEPTTDAVLARAEEGEQVFKFEGNWYFDPASVAQGALVTTDRTYTCPSKGTCHWVDFVGPDGATVKDVAWVYARTKPGHEKIAGRYGFHAGTRGGTRQEG